MRKNFPYQNLYEVPDHMSSSRLAALRDHLPPSKECSQMIHEIQAALFRLSFLGNNEENDADTISIICMIFAAHNVLTGVLMNELTAAAEEEKTEFTVPTEILPFL